MSPAPSPHQDPIGAILRRLFVLLAGMLGAIIADLTAEHDHLPPRHPMRPVLRAQIAATSRLRAQFLAQSAAPPPAALPASARPARAPAHAPTRHRASRRIRPAAHHPRPLYPPNRPPAHASRPKTTARKAAPPRAHSP